MYLENLSAFVPGSLSEVLEIPPGDCTMLQNYDIQIFLDSEPSILEVVLLDMKWE